MPDAVVRPLGLLTLKVLKSRWRERRIGTHPRYKSADEEACASKLKSEEQVMTDDLCDVSRDNRGRHQTWSGNDHGRSSSAAPAVPLDRGSRSRHEGIISHSLQRSQEQGSETAAVPDPSEDDVAMPDQLRANDTLGVRVDPRGRGLRRVLFVAAVVVAGLLGSYAEPLSDVVIYRKDSGEVIVKGAAPMDPGYRDWLLQRMRSAMANSTEQQFLDRWRDPSGWAVASGFTRE